MTAHGPARRGPGILHQLRKHVDSLPQDPDTAFIEAAWLIILGRTPDRTERRKALQQLRTGHRIDLTAGLLSSSEFSRRRRTWLESDWTIIRSGVAGLAGLGTNAKFVERCYACLLGRKADEASDVYVSQLDGGADRIRVVGALVQSDDFADRIRVLCPGLERTFLEAGFWILLGREPTSVERAEGLEQLGGGQAHRNKFTVRLLSSVEFP